jgi:heptosyltransferase-2
LATPTIGIFGPTSPWHWAPLNPLAATMETAAKLDCRPCHQPVCRFGHHRCMTGIAPDAVIAATERALAAVTAAMPG